MEAGRSVKAVLNCLGCSIRPSPTLPAIASATAGSIPGSSKGRTTDFGSVDAWFRIPLPEHMVM